MQNFKGISLEDPAHFDLQNYVESRDIILFGDRAHFLEQKYKKIALNNKQGVK